MNDDVAIKVTKVGKSFKLPHDRQNSIKGGLISLVKGGKRSYEKQEVLKDVSFEIKKGEFFGIVGRNGSGKSTLLKMLAGIYIPTAGSIRINGSLTPFIELGVGFNMELTGRENVYLNGALLGFNRKQMDEMYDDIVDFAELERFMDQKLKNYSSGMQVRLAFSIAIRAQGDILLLDEVLAVGDTAFQQKCFEYFNTIKNLKKTVILVTHDMSAVERFCTSAMLINKGAVEIIGSPREVSENYKDLNREELERGLVKGKKNNELEDRSLVSDGAQLVKCEVLDANGTKRKAFRTGETITINVVYKAKRKIDDAAADIGVTLGVNGVLYVYDNTDYRQATITCDEGNYITLNYKIEAVITGGIYNIVTSLYNKKTLEVFARDRQAAKISIDQSDKSGLVQLDSRIKVSIEERK